MRPADLPLLLSSTLTETPGSTFPLDRIRMQKAVFLLTQGAPEWKSLYRYEPYNWGPYSGALVADVGDLRAQALVTTRAFPGSQYDSYAATPTGEDLARSVWWTLEDRERTFIQAVRHWVTSRSFSTLLRDVYAAYPEFATKSRFRG